LSLFSAKHGIVPACDVNDLDSLSTLVRHTCSLKFIQGYRVGMSLMLAYGVDAVVKKVRQLTSLPIIYEHQKFGTDIPEICGGDILEMFKREGIDAIIFFPFAGIESLKATIQGCKRVGITPIVGAEMTHPGFFCSEGGYPSTMVPQSGFSEVRLS
jgi:orotidine-5'-phosphate decarboxylase